MTADPVSVDIATEVVALGWDIVGREFVSLGIVDDVIMFVLLGKIAEVAEIIVELFI